MDHDSEAAGPASAMPGWKFVVWWPVFQLLRVVLWAFIRLAWDRATAAGFWRDAGTAIREGR